MEVATIGGVLVICRSILSAASNIKDLAEDWFTVTDDYESKVDALRQGLDFYQQQISRHGVKVTSRMVTTLRGAEKLLKDQEEKLKRLNGAVWRRLYAKSTMIAFPKKLEKTIKRVSDEIDKITAQFKMEVDMSTCFRTLGEQKPVDTTIRDNDGLYVAIEETQNEVIHAIEDSTGPSIIFLHGGVGKGKSTLARKMCEHFGKSGPKRDIFQHIVLVPCGNRTVTNPATKQLELLKRLCPDSLYESMEEPTSGDNNPKQWTRLVVETNSAARIAEALKDFLRSKRILAILDDVSDRDFLMEMWKAAPGGRSISPSDETKMKEMWATQGEKFADPAHVEVFSNIFEDLCKRNVSDFKSFERVWKTALDVEITNVLENGRVFQRMWEVTQGPAQGSQHVKYLVTSQNSRLCKSLSQYSLPILMRDPSIVEAKKILASHLGCKDQLIPEDSQEIATEMIESVDRNPLALACLASSITYPDEEWAWDEANEALQTNLLENMNSTKAVLGSDYASPPMAAMRLCIDSLTIADAKVVLFLMYCCKSESVPEEVLRILYSMTKSLNLFSNSLEEVRSRELLKSNPSTLSPKINLQGNHKSRAWSLRSLVKLCMARDMAESANSTTRSVMSWNEVRSQMSALLGGDGTEGSSGGQSNDDPHNNLRVAITLRSLYFDGAHADDLVRKLATEGHLIDATKAISDLRRRAIEPIVWLLAQPKKRNNTWTEAHIHSARQVFLKYVCDQKLDDDSICELLNVAGYDLAPLATLAAIADICEIEEVPLLNQGRPRFLEVLVNFLESSMSDSVSQRKNGKAIAGLMERDQLRFREYSCKAIAYISRKAYLNEKAVLLTVAETPRILTILLHTLRHTLAHPSGEENPNSYAALALDRLASAGDSVRSQILNDEDSLPTLVQYLSLDSHPTFQFRGAAVLEQLANGHESNTSKVLHQDQVLACLVKSLSQESNEHVQEHAARALAKLARGPESIKAKILEDAHALQLLVQSLSQDSSKALQHAAACALAELAAGPEFMKAKILEDAQALPLLVQSLSQDNNEGLQSNAACALARLAAGPEFMKAKILEDAQAIPLLVQSLSQDNNEGLQRNAASALAKLAAGPEFMKAKILEDAQALPLLVQSLSQDNNEGLQSNAACALARLAAGPEFMKAKILEDAQAIPLLVQSLSQDNNEGLQRNAASALAKLAAGPEFMKAKILEDAQALPLLVQSLSQDNNEGLQRNAASALAELAAGPEFMKAKILEDAQAIPLLVQSLSQDSSKALQQAAVYALAGLAEGSDSIKSKILEDDRAVPLLVQSLSQDNNECCLCLQGNAASALARLAAGPEFMKAKILEDAQAIPLLVQSLSQDSSKRLQHAAACALAELAAGPEFMKAKILEDAQAIPLLVQSLSQDSSKALQQAAVYALAGLAEGSDSIKSKILEDDRAVPLLVQSLSQDNNECCLCLQGNAAFALAELAAGPEFMKAKILEDAHAIPLLVQSLSQDNNEGLQCNAASALGRLSRGSDSIKSKIMQECRGGALSGLVKALAKDSNPGLQRNASAALAWLADGEESIKSKIVEEHGIFDSLSRCLSKQNPKEIQLQINAAWALWNLKEADDSIRSKILNEEGVFAGWVESLTDDDVLEQRYAARAFKSFTNTGERSLKVRMIKEAGLMTNLTKLAAERDDPVTQEAALVALKNLEGITEPFADMVEQDTSGSSGQVGGVQVSSAEPNGLGEEVEKTRSAQ